MADHTGSVLVDVLEQLDTQLAAKVAAVAQSKSENFAEASAKAGTKADSMLSELPEWLEFHVKSLKKGLNGQGVHADRVAALEDSVLYKCQELRSENSGKCPMREAADHDA